MSATYPQRDGETILTPTEREAQRIIVQRNCWNCNRLIRHPRSGYRGCEEGHATQPVIDGVGICEDWEAR